MTNLLICRPATSQKELDERFVMLFFLDVIMELGMGMMIGVIFINIGFQTFFATATSGWDSTTILIWKAIPWAVLSAVITAFLHYSRNPSGY